MLVETLINPKKKFLKEVILFGILQVWGGVPRRRRGVHVCDGEGPSVSLQETQHS
jgi:hypothetical protein